MQALDLGALAVGEGRAAELLPAGPGPGETSFGALADPLRLHLRERCHDGQEDVTHELVVGGEVLFGVGVKVDAVDLEPLQVADGLRHALPAEAVQRPEQHQVELAPGRGREELGKCLALALALPAALMLDVLMHERVAGTHAPRPQLQQLVLGTLSFVVGRYPCVDGDAA